ncbi:hypothetical protein [Bradyrhizobium neotropicale]|uniref:hypothetical protein n=1 Tax=Bradyrhizobium neotropicale TaxID=1497615 RepID=UPI001AD7C976|nr:hypothetical protein [Bradyrhizobium neotropicale]MBO4225109.1 hypothetical protein [Bradyrhizobium neotropicale]
MPLDAKQLAKEITEHVHAAASAQATGGAAAQTAGGAAADAIGGDFCSIWPQAKPVLGFVAGIVAFIPGLGTTAGAVLQGLIKVGDQISAEVCKQ